MVARARGRARQRAWSVAGGQIGNTGTFRGKPRRNGCACGRQYLRSAICATRSKGLCGPAAGIRTTPDHLSHWHRCQWQGRESFRAQAVQGPGFLAEAGSAHFGAGVAQLLRLTLGLPQGPAARPRRTACIRTPALLFCRRHQPRRPPLAKIRPGKKEPRVGVRGAPGVKRG
jgi:hypothetical protein